MCTHFQERNKRKLSASQGTADSSHQSAVQQILFCSVIPIAYDTTVERLTSVAGHTLTHAECKRTHWADKREAAGATKLTCNPGKKSSAPTTHLRQREKASIVSLLD